MVVENGHFAGVEEDADVGDGERLEAWEGREKGCRRVGGEEIVGNTEVAETVQVLAQRRVCVGEGHVVRARGDVDGGRGEKAGEGFRIQDRVDGQKGKRQGKWRGQG